MGTISISETPLVTLTGTYEWLWTTSQWKIEADTVRMFRFRVGCFLGFLKIG